MLKTLPFLLALLFVSARTGAETSPTYQPASVRVLFSPLGGCTEAIVSAVNDAKKSVFVQAYSFTSSPIAKAIVDAHKRGVEVRVILDKSQRTERYSSADYLANAGVPVAIDAKHAIAHNKIIILDGGTVITGSFNFTQSAEERNAENLLIITDAALAARYLSNWDEHAAHSEPYQGKMEAAQADEAKGGTGKKR